MKLTLDWNCVIEVEEERPQARSLIDLVNAHRDGEFEVALLAASASENNKSKLFPGNAKFFTERIEKLGWQDLPLVPMPAVFGLSYWDFCFMIANGEEFERDFNSLWQVIAPNVPRTPSDHISHDQIVDDDIIQSAELSKWRNTWCDVISAYSHIHAARDIFVTNNTRDFQANSSSLSTLGMKHISIPAETRSLIHVMVQTGL